MIEKGIVITTIYKLFPVSMIIFKFSSYILYIEVKGVDRGIGTEIATDQVAREDLFLDRQVKIR